MKAKVQSGIPSLLSEDAALWRGEGITSFSVSNFLVVGSSGKISD